MARIQRWQAEQAEQTEQADRRVAPDARGYDEMQISTAGRRTNGEEGFA